MLLKRVAVELSRAGDVVATAGIKIIGAGEVSIGGVRTSWVIQDSIANLLCPCLK